MWLPENATLYMWFACRFSWTLGTRQDPQSVADEGLELLLLLLMMRDSQLELLLLLLIISTPFRGVVHFSL